MISETDLILNKHHRAYHLDLSPDEVPDWIITVGDPERVPKVTKYFDKIHFKRKHRQFHSHLGELESKKILVLSTGIGTDNIDIVLNELDALVNIDFNNRTVKKSTRRLNVIRIGTSGSIQATIAVDSILVNKYAIGVDSLMQFYKHKFQALPQSILEQSSSDLATLFSMSYLGQADSFLFNHFKENHHVGVAITSPGFYGPQGRQLRLKSTGFTIDLLSKMKYQNMKLTNIEMETAGIYALSNALAHRSISINAILANRATKVFSKNPEKTIDKLIQQSLARLSELKKDL